MIFNDIFLNTQEIEVFKELYFSAFPQEERVPFDFLANKAQLGNSNLYTLYDDDLFVGILVLVFHNDMVFLWYLAVDKNLQGKGYGTKILNLVEQKYKEMYEGGDDPMTAEEKKAFDALKIKVDELTKAVDDVKIKYNDADKCPVYAQSTIKKLIDKGHLMGDAGGKLTLTEQMIRTLVILDRAGQFD